MKKRQITCTDRPRAAPDPGDSAADGGRAYHQEARVAVKSAGRVQRVVSSVAEKVSVIRPGQRGAFQVWGAQTSSGLASTHLHKQWPIVKARHLCEKHADAKILDHGGIVCLASGNPAVNGVLVLRAGVWEWMSEWILIHTRV